MTYNFYVVVEHTREGWHGTTQTMTFSLPAFGTEEWMRSSLHQHFTELLAGDQTVTAIHVNGSIV